MIRLNRAFILVLLLVFAIFFYLLGIESGIPVLFFLGILFEATFWVSLLKRRKRQIQS